MHATLLNSIRKMRLLDSKPLKLPEDNSIQRELPSFVHSAAALSPLRFSSRYLVGGNIDLHIHASNIKKGKEIHYKAVQLLSLLRSLAPHRCSQHNLSIHLFLTSLKKKEPVKGQPFSQENANSGFTIVRGWSPRPIVIYRLEECIKVLAHELIHAYDMDFRNVSERECASLLQKCMCAPSTVMVCESYCEFWATILHASLCVANERGGVVELRERMKCYIDFAFSQCKRALRSQKIEDLRDITAQFKEVDTQAFSYYVLKCMALSHCEEVFRRFPIWTSLGKREALQYTRLLADTSTDLQFLRKVHFATISKGMSMRMVPEICGSV